MDDARITQLEAKIAQLEGRLSNLLTEDRARAIATAEAENVIKTLTIQSGQGVQVSGQGRSITISRQASQMTATGQGVCDPDNPGTLILSFQFSGG